MLEGRSGSGQIKDRVRSENKDKAGAELSVGRRGKQLEVKVVA